jgi:prolipoprotein diacylglyceryltransferase
LRELIEPTLIHTLFDVAAAISAFVVAYLVHRWRLSESGQVIVQAGVGYAAALITGAAIGGYGLGTLNMQLSGQPGVGRSVIGALAGAIVGVELWKGIEGLKRSTGLIFVPSFATSIVVGRVGCFFSGMSDFTYGTATSLAWGHDFGDGVLRHPVQIYEALSMAAFLALALECLRRRSHFFMRNGFYVMVAWYGLQRYQWERYKPYARLDGSHTLFQLVALALIAYSAVMIWRTEHAGRLA